MIYVWESSAGIFQEIFCTDMSFTDNMKKYYINTLGRLSFFSLSLF